MPKIPAPLRKQIIERALERCEYCQTQSAITGEEMEVDHIQPVSRAGQTHADNLCLACRACNGNKNDFSTSIDPQTETTVALFNPRTQRWNDHFQWSDSGIAVIGLTPTGRATIEILKMNRPNIVRARKRWVDVGWHPPK
jgi:predicted restriction endonuclease